MKYGMTTKMSPTVNRSTVLEMKYGTTISASPARKGTMVRCFLPWMKNPNPTEPNRTPKSKDEEDSAATTGTYL
jgi:hypothetical protein